MGFGRLQMEVITQPLSSTHYNHGSISMTSYNHSFITMTSYLMDYLMKG